MEQFIWNYAPLIILVVIVLSQFKIFVRPEDVDNKIKEAGFMTPAEFEARRADFEKHIAKNYISKETYYYNHEDLKQETASIKTTLEKIDNKIDERNVEDRKMLLEVMNALVKKEK